MKNELKVGDRVAVYDTSNRYVGRVQERHDDGRVLIRPDPIQYTSFWVHPKQCRRLVKRKPREWWVVKFGAGFVAYEELSDAGVSQSGAIHVREVLPKKGDK